VACANPLISEEQRESLKPLSVRSRIIKVSLFDRQTKFTGIVPELLTDAMESNYETPVTEQRVDRRFSTEKVSSGERMPIRDETHRASDATFSPEIAPAYKNDKAYNHEIDLERGDERLPGEIKQVDSSSMESPGKIGATDEIGEDEEYPPSWLTRTWRKYRPFGHAIIWLLVTAYFPDEANSNSRWWICGLVLHRDEWLIPFLLWLAITLWIIFQYIPITVVSTCLRNLTMLIPDHFFGGGEIRL
jgi:hypothetical protein